MNLWNKWLFGLGILAAFLVPVLMAQDLPTGVMNGLKLPLDHNPDGSVKTVLIAQRAQAKSNLVDVTGMRVEMKSATGTVETVIEADYCTFDKVANLAESKSDIKLTRPDVEISGTGFRWSAKDERIEIMANVRVILKQGMQMSLLGR